MAKKKRSKARKAHKNPRKRSRAKRANPVRRRKAHRRTTSNPSRRSRKRRAHANPARRRRSSRRNPARHVHRRRGHRRNPAMHPIVAGGLAVLLSLGVAAVEGMAPVFISKDVATQGNIRMGLGAAGTIGGLLLVKKHPVLGIAIAAPSFALLATGPLSNFLVGLLTPKAAPQTTAASPAAATTKGLQRQLGALIAQNAPLQLGAVYSENMGAVYSENMGAVYSENMGAMAPPWNQGTPFG